MSASSLNILKQMTTRQMNNAFNGALPEKPFLATLPALLGKQLSKSELAEFSLWLPQQDLNGRVLFDYLNKHGAVELSSSANALPAAKLVTSSVLSTSPNGCLPSKEDLNAIISLVRDGLTKEGKAEFAMWLFQYTDASGPVLMERLTKEGVL